MPEDDEINFKNDEDDFSPREEKIKAWRKKKKDESAKNKKERRQRLADRASEISRKEVEKEEARELDGPVQAQPRSTEPPNPAFGPALPGGVYKKPRRSRKKTFDIGRIPGLFDDVE